jgi:hypothetical protein
MTNPGLSRVTARTIDGLRVALAGLPGDMRVVPLQEGTDFGASTVAEMRAWTSMPRPLDIFLPYVMRDSTVVVIGEHDPDVSLA